MVRRVLAGLLGLLWIASASAQGLQYQVPFPGDQRQVLRGDGTFGLIQNFQIKDPVIAATTGVLPFTPSYSNGTNGQGATLTGTIGILTFDGYTSATVGDRLLVKNQGSSFQNGVYTVTTVGTIGIGYVLTRATDFDTTLEIVYGDTVAVLQGTVNANQQFTMNNQNAITVGTTAITFAQTSGGSQLSGTSPVTVTGNAVGCATCLTANQSIAISGVASGSGTTAITLAGPVNLATTALTQTVPNSSSPGTATNKLAILASGAYQARTALTTSTTNIVGVCQSGCTTTGNAVLAVGGTAACVFDGATTEADWVVASTTVAGDCHDGGATTPVNVQVLGQVTSTNGAGGTYNLDLNPVGIMGGGGAAGSLNLTSAHVFVGNSGNIAKDVALSGDCTMANTGAITCTKTNAVSFATSATTDTTNGSNISSGTVAAARLAATTLATGTSVSLTSPREYYVCTGTCTVTPPVPAAGYEFCVMNDDNVATVITLAALGSSSMYENTARIAYGTAGTGTLVSAGAAADSVCIVGRDSTHYLTTNFKGTWTAN